MKRRLMLIMMVSFLVFSGFAAAGTEDSLATFKEEAGTIKISGGTAHIPVMKAAAKQIMQANGKIQITIAAGGSGVGIKQVGEGLVDIGNSGRKPTAEELKKYPLKMHQWAIDGVAVVVNPQNPVNALKTEDLLKIYAGELTNWKELGGVDKGINIYTRDEASGTRDVFWKKALNKGKISAKALLVTSNGAMKTAVAQDPYSIGYVSVGHVDPSVTPVALDGVAPTLENVKSGKYKIARGLYSNTNGDPKGLTKKFIDFLYSQAGQKLVAQKGFIPVK